MNTRCHAGMAATEMAQATMSTAVLPTNKCPSTTILPESGLPLKPAEWGIVGVIRLINERGEAHDIVLHLLIIILRSTNEGTSKARDVRGNPYRQGVPVERRSPSPAIIAIVVVILLFSPPRAIGDDDDVRCVR